MIRHKQLPGRRTRSLFACFLLYMVPPYASSAINSMPQYKQNASYYHTGWRGLYSLYWVVHLLRISLTVAACPTQAMVDGGSPVV